HENRIIAGSAFRPLMAPIDVCDSPGKDSNGRDTFCSTRFRLLPGASWHVDKWKVLAMTHIRHKSLIIMLTLFGMSAWSAGTPVGTVVDNVASVNFDIGAINVTQLSNTTSITVVERIDVVVTLQSAQVAVTSGDTNRSLLFTITNTGNGSEAYELTIDNVLAGDDFDPLQAVPAIYFDTDASGDFSVGDIAYTLGVNDPVLAADATVDILLVNDIPAAVVNGNLGRSELTATSTTGTGAPGDTFAGLGDGNVDAVIGTTGGEDAVFGEYLVADVQFDIVKSVAVSDPFGGTQPTPGATLTYTITAEMTSPGTAAAAVFSDAIPAFTTYVADSILLNGGSLTDALADDAGELDTSGAPTIVVRLGDLTLADGIQTVVFQVTID
ncbi:MAG: DUF11 domain-containing protein, partial [Proteobacteria bacterium]|nr:DUF11 domain-containing protein [Pseudomonadota bacterium]